ncbi:MAG: roadblock/LC7 domain-containing protein [Deltaproteobacteria bacterium]|nr:roadblock/LC7 domain-containing protein [Deltaproteobacteria bacterium]
MEFKGILREMVDGVDGGYAGTIMEKGGITVEDYVREGSGCDIETLGVEYGKALDEIRKASRVLKLGDAEEIVISSGGNRVILRIVTPDYFLAFAVRGGAALGKARYLVRKAASRAGKELLR